MKRAVVIPAYNEERTIGAVVTSLRPHCSFCLVVDDGSADSTSELAREAGAIVLRHIINRGQGAALATGTEKALQLGAQVIIHFDADGQHSGEDIAGICAPIEASICDVVFGSRFLGEAKDIPKTRKMLLKLAVFFTRWATGLKVTDAHNGFRAFSVQASKTISMTQDRMAHSTEIVIEVAQKKLSWREVPVNIYYTNYSLSKGQSSIDIFHILVDLFFAKF